MVLGLGFRQTAGGSKVEVAHFILARHAETANDGSFSTIGAGMDDQFVPELPALFPAFFALIKVTLEAHDLDRAHTMKIIIVDPAGAQIFTSETLEVASREEIAEGQQYVFANLLMNLQNLIFWLEGLYRFQLFYDELMVKETRLRVHKRELLSSLYVPKKQA
jgi:hypothetical protein